MKKYIIDYTKLSQVDDLLYRAQRLFANGCYNEVLMRINEAREILQRYLAGDNNIIDRESVGFILGTDSFDEEQLAFIRDEFACIMEQTNNSNGELDIINKCCRLLEDPEFESYEEFEKNNSGTWAEKKIEEE